MELEELKLLIVDDEEDLLEVFSELFELEVQVVHTAKNGQEGLDVFLNNEVDVIISDYTMPVMTGTEFLERVLSSDKEKPYFFFSTGAVDFSDERVKSLGADGIFEKPFDLDRILDILRDRVKDGRKAA